MQVRLENVTKKFPGVTAVNTFSVTLPDGELICLLGPSGCGKSTILNMLSGILPVSGGDIYFDEDNVTKLPPEERGIGLVFQNYALYPHMTVLENICFPLEIKRVPKDERVARATKMAKLVHVDMLLNRKPKELSGGQQQRVAIARALVKEPRLLLLDEPLSNLDAKLRESMRFEIKEIQRQYGITVVYVTHDQTEAMAMSDRIVVINRGVIQQVGSPRTIYSEPANPFIADFVGKIDFVEGVASEGVIALNDCDQKLPYKGELRGNVIVGVRPENIKYAEKDKGMLRGVVKSHFYLGDVDDCRVDLGGGQELRIIADPYESRNVENGKQVELDVRSFLVYPQKPGEDFRKILT